MTGSFLSGPDGFGVTVSAAASVGDSVCGGEPFDCGFADSGFGGDLTMGALVDEVALIRLSSETQRLAIVNITSSTAALQSPPAKLLDGLTLTVILNNTIRRA
ncbi:hypothetical protein [Rhodococcus sp. NPDC003348]